MNQLQAFRDTVALAERHGMPEAEDSTLGLAHLRAMLTTIENTSTFDRAKLGRWLGWAQCAVVAANIGLTLDDMKTLNASHDDPGELRAPDGTMLEANPAMVRLHRVARGWSKLHLAEHAAVHSSHVSRIEAGHFPLAGYALTGYANALNCTTAALCATYTPSPARGARPAHTISAAEWKRDRTWARANLAAMRIGRLAAHVDLDPALPLPTLDIDDYTDDQQQPIAAAAAVLRRLWRLSGPITSITTLLEAAGVFVVLADDPTPTDHNPTVTLAGTDQHPHLIYADATLPTDRLRLELATALAHLVLDPPADPRAAARQATAFAHEFLAPIDDITPALTRVSTRTIHEVDELRQHWGVTDTSLLDRSHQHGLHTDRQRHALRRLLAETGRIPRSAGLKHLTEKPALAAGIATQLTDAGYTTTELDEITLCSAADRALLLNQKRRALTAIT